MKDGDKWAADELNKRDCDSALALIFSLAELHRSFYKGAVFRILFNPIIVSRPCISGGLYSDRCGEVNKNIQLAEYSMVRKPQTTGL